jgi:hypothetical protein
VPFGFFQIKKGSEIFIANDITNTEREVLSVHYKDDNNTLSLPIYCKNYGISLIGFLDEICRLNTFHNSYLEYANSMEKAKEKAKELVLNHFQINGGVISESDITYVGTKIWNEAKLNALLTINEILKTDEYLTDYQYINGFEPFSFFRLVRDEINNL